MLYAFSLPTKADKVPAGPDWLHEIKYDGYRMMVIREGERVRLISRGGHDWARYFPRIVTGALKLRRSDFDALHSGKHYTRAQIYAFDILAGDGEDHRRLTLALGKANLARMLSRHVKGVFIAEYEQGEIGPDLFRVACNVGLDSIVSKCRDPAYGAGRSSDWIKVKNPGTWPIAG